MLRDHTTVNLGDMCIPLIGVPPSAGLEKCDRCGKDNFKIQEIEFTDTQLLCKKCMSEQQTELVPVPSGERQIATVSEPDGILRYAIDRGASAETVERLMGVRRELIAERARKEFDDALASFQGECPVIVKHKAVVNKDGRSVRYKYAPLDTIVSQTKELLEKHGFSYTLTADVSIAERSVKAILTIKHRGGHSQQSTFAVPIDPDAFMNQQQKFAAALTFAKRYAFCNGFGILTGDEDTDGQTATEKPQGPSTIAAETPKLDALRTELWNLMKPVRGAEPSWKIANRWLWDETIINDNEEAPKFTAERFREVIEKVRKKCSSMPKL